MVEQPKYLEMTLSQLKSYVESSESNVFLSGSRSDQLPSDACNGTERSRSYRNSRSSRNIYGYFRSNVATGSDLLACKGKSRLLSKCQTVPSGTEGNRQVSLAL